MEGSEAEPPLDGPEDAEGGESPSGVAALEEPEDETLLEAALAAAACNPGSRTTRGG